MRPFFLLIAAFASMVVMQGVVHAQSSQPTAPESEANASTLDTKQTLSEDQRELDKLLLGAWAMVTDDSQVEMTDELFLMAIQSCGTVSQIKTLNAEPGLKKGFPDRKDVRGQLVYFQTDQGVQRFQTNPGSVVLLTDVKKTVNAGGRTVWRVSGRFAQFSFAFFQRFNDSEHNSHAGG